MGSIFKSRKPPPPAPTPVAPAPITVAPPEPPSDDDNAAQESEERQRNLLRRNRGRLGTIATSFQGFLAPTNNDDGRKTLLGE